VHFIIVVIISCMFLFVQSYCNGTLYKNPISIILLRYRRKTFTVVNICQISQIFSQYHKGLLKRFRSTGGFLTTQQLFSSSSDPKKRNCCILKCFYLVEKKHNCPKKNVGGTHTKDTKNADQNAGIPPEALIGGRLNIKMVLWSKLVVSRATEAN